eukprot:CAMPEP_0206150778 /NCGR_PEP_ID=MMETSP1473-20131121/38478_1 /ASSEMBLY_ACC=CAM_ASM_001109 /TAXON_ID=1461547 /ORGANISM="Stichococcus sp, Strain RCC1054" /LENGTH=81 /DNA_ID=CAMNT_0053548299 /DNA_START=1099 /DNA_END=1347 /DNA_ORIENTATION=+
MPPQLQEARVAHQSVHRPRQHKPHRQQGNFTARCVPAKLSHSSHQSHCGCDGCDAHAHWLKRKEAIPGVFNASAHTVSQQH